MAAFTNKDGKEYVPGSLVEFDGVSYSLGGKTRDKPVTQEYLQKLMSAVQATDPDLQVKIVSAGQDRKGTGTKRTGSTRHDVDKNGFATTADLILVKNGKEIRPGDDKGLYSKFLQNAATVGFTGIGHYGWGVHIGGGSPASWGPSTTGRDLDPEFAKAIKAGRKAAELGVRLPYNDLGTDAAPRPAPLTPGVTAARENYSNGLIAKLSGASESPGPLWEALARSGNTSPAAMGVTSRLPDGYDFGSSEPFTVPASELAKYRAGNSIPMDQSNVQARATLLDEGLGALMGSRSFSPATPNPSPVRSSQPLPLSGPVNSRSSSVAAARRMASLAPTVSKAPMVGGARDKSPSTSKMDPVGPGTSFQQVQNFASPKITSPGIAGTAVMPPNVRPAAAGPMPKLNPLLQQATTAKQMAAPLSAPGAGLTAAQRNAMTSLAGLPPSAPIAPPIPLPRPGQIAQQPPVPLSRPVVPPVPLSRPVAASQAVPAPVPRSYSEAGLARANALPAPVQATNGYWYQPNLDGTYSRMKDGPQQTAVGSMIDIPPRPGAPAAAPAAGEVAKYTSKLNPNTQFRQPGIGGAIENWWDTTLIGRGINLMTGKPQAPLFGNGIFGSIAGLPKLPGGVNPTASGGGLLGGGLFGSGLTAARDSMGKPVAVGGTKIGGATYGSGGSSYGSDPGQVTSGLRPGERTYNPDTNSWGLK